MLKVSHIEKMYKKPGLWTNERKTVLHDVSFRMEEGECLGIIGESGSGKSTLGRIILGIEKPDRGEVLFRDKNVRNRSARAGMVSAVFQDYTSSVSPGRKVRQAIEEPLRNKNMPCDSRVVNGLLEKTGLDPVLADRYLHELSGGQAQRVCIARAIAAGPSFLMLDEAVSSLDVSIQAQILDLLKSLREEMGVGYLFITHDIVAAAYICSRLIVLREGRIVETLSADDLGRAKDPYTRKLFSAVITV